MDNDKKKSKYTSKRQKYTDKVTKIDSVRKKAKDRSKQHKTKSNIYYSFLTIVLLVCLVQMSFSAILNISKTIS